MPGRPKIRHPRVDAYLDALRSSEDTACGLTAVSYLRARAILERELPSQVHALRNADRVSVRS